MKIRYGTRGSALALAQSFTVEERLRRMDPSLEIECVVIHTSGDRRSAVAPAAEADAVAEASDNVKALFVKEIEEALLAGGIDFAVHSCKDLPGDLPPGLCLPAYPPREDSSDVYMGGTVRSWKDLKAGDRIATASLRRQIQLRMAAPGIEFVSMRGNVDTRIRKLKAGAAAGLVLAEAGLRRLGLNSEFREILPVEIMVPAPGQGTLALEAREDRPDILKILAGLDDSRTRVEAECERLFMRMTGGGCRMPLGGRAAVRDGRMTFFWFWSDEAGERPARGSFECSANTGSFEEKAAEVVRSLPKG